MFAPNDIIKFLILYNTIYTSTDMTDEYAYMTINRHTDNNIKYMPIVSYLFRYNYLNYLYLFLPSGLLVFIIIFITKTNFIKLCYYDIYFI